MKIDSVVDRPMVEARQARGPGPVTPAAKPAIDPAHSPQAAPAGLAASESEVDAAIHAANQQVQTVATNLKFEKDSTSGKLVVRVVDSETQQILRQMPSEEMLAMSKALDRLQGLMVRHKV